MAQSNRITTLVLGVLLSIGCGENPTAAATMRQVTERDGLRLELDMERRVLAIGDSSTVTMRLRNLNAEPVQLAFGSSCQIMPYIESAAGTIEYPGGGAWACAAVITSLVVPANGSVTRTLLVRGRERTEMLPGASLPRGPYRAYALLETSINGRQLRSPTVEFEVR